MGVNDKLGQALTSPTFRGTLLFFVGLGLTVREAFVNGPERPSAYILWAAMMGFPLVNSIAGGKKEQ